MRIFEIQAHQLNLKKPTSSALLSLLFTLLTLCGIASGQQPATAEAPGDPGGVEGKLLKGIRQLTFVGKRTGESYFSPDGSMMIFQSERDPENPFYQIFAMDLETGDTWRVSPGHGKTTCAWFHPDGKRVLFASTQDDPDALKKQKEELDFRASGQSRRYAWDYDETFEIFESDLQGGDYRNLTQARGYDAEGSWSPDGRQIVFSSNRHAFSETLSDKEAKLFEVDASSQVDIYVMNADGTRVKRLTRSLGYDGGPFFSPDGKQITWRRFSEDGATAEIFVMNADGTQQRALTRLGAMSWAPFFHPSGDYLIFTNNLNGFGNFELYLVDSGGKGEPIRVTYTDGFDGLPVFSPDGKLLAWTSNRSADRTSQVFLAEWEDVAARELLGLRAQGAAPIPILSEARPDFARTAAEITPEDLRMHVEYLASGDLEGRMTGTRGELLATQYVADYLQSIGLAPAGTNGTYFQEFEFTAGVSLGESNQLSLKVEEQPEVDFSVDRDWRPLAFSQVGDFPEAAVVFAGYGIVAPAKDDFEEYDSYVHLDVKDKWVLVLRYVPEDISQEHRQHLARFASLRYKAMAARDHGARGILVASGPRSNVKEQLIDLRFDASLAATSIAAISVSDEVAQRMLQTEGRELGVLQSQLDSGQPMMGITLPGAILAARVDIQQEKRKGRNVLAKLYAGSEPGQSAVAIGAHVDHLGVGKGSTSLAKPDEEGLPHYGADDNASGTAGVLEIAQYLADQKSRGRLPMKRDLLVGIWSGEELGILGSNFFAEELARSLSGNNPHSPPSLQPAVVAYLNLDMIGRLDKTLAVQGVGSSSIWPSEIEQRNAPIGLPISTQDDSYLPTDATAFFLKGVPILSAFTGAHSDYHTPRDTADRINYEGASRISRLFGLIGRSLVLREESPDYVAQAKPESSEARSGIRVYLGTIPDYTQGDVKGMKLSGVAAGGPAEKAGVQAGDVVVELAGRKIENIYDYTYAIDALKVGEPATVVVVRNGERLTMTIVPASRD